MPLEIEDVDDHEYLAYVKMKRWRLLRSRALETEAYNIFQNRTLLELVRPGGLIIVDNVLWYGKVADAEVNDKQTEAIRAFNEFVAGDERVSYSMIPVGDGLSFCRKR